MTTEADRIFLTDGGFTAMLPGIDSFGSRNNTEDGHYLGSDDDVHAMDSHVQKIRIIVPVIFALLLVLGLVANVLVVYVTIVSNRTAQHPIHSIFVLNLAVADVLFLLVTAPYWMTSLIISRWRFGAFLCPVFPFLSTTTVAGSIYTICALAWIRFMALVMPFRFRRSCISTRKAGYVVVIAIWIAGAILSLPYLFYYRLQKMPGMGSATACRWDVGSQHANHVYSIVKLTANYMFPLLLVTFFYVVVGREVLCYMMRRNSVMQRGPSDERKECIKSTVVVLSLILAFLLCWLPHFLETIFSIIGAHFSPLGSVILELVGKCLAYAHAFVNPFIYTFASPIFRRKLRSSFREKMRNCRNANSICTKREAASVVQSKRNKGHHLHLVVTNKNQNCSDAQTFNLIGNGNHDVTTPRSERYSHPTEITRLASPDLTNCRHCTQTTLAVVEESDDEDVGNRPMLSREECDDKVHENTISKIGEKDERFKDSAL